MLHFGLKSKEDQESQEFKVFEPETRKTVIKDEPYFELDMNEDIYNLAFTMCLKTEKLVEILEEKKADTDNKMQF